MDIETRLFIYAVNADNFCAMMFHLEISSGIYSYHRCHCYVCLLRAKSIVCMYDCSGGSSEAVIRERWVQ